MQTTTMVAGEDFIVTFVVLVNDVPDPDFASFAARIDLRKNLPQGDLVETWSDGDAEIVRDDAAATITLKIPAQVTNDYSFNLAFLDLLLLGSNGGRRSAALKINIDRGVTR